MSSQRKPLCTIVGAGRGVSLAVAQTFGRSGFDVALIARQISKLETLCNSLRDEGIKSLAVAGDAGEEASLQDAIGRVHAESGMTEVLIYNAAAIHQATPTKLTLSRLRRDFQVNVGGALIAVQAVVPAMRNAGRGTILLTGGGLALNPAAAVSSLSIGKAALRSLAFSLFQELQPDGIHAATVTICGMVQEGTHFGPDKIAAEFLKLHRQNATDWTPEIVYR
jgi:short-subunit dehydrogenase